MPFPTQMNDQWWVNDQTPDNPFGKSEDYEAFLDYVGALLQLAAQITRNFIIFDVISRASERHSFSPAT